MSEILLSTQLPQVASDARSSARRGQSPSPTGLLALVLTVAMLADSLCLCFGCAPASEYAPRIVISAGRSFRAPSSAIGLADQLCWLDETRKLSWRSEGTASRLLSRRADPFRVRRAKTSPAISLVADISVTLSVRLPHRRFLRFLQLHS